MAQKYDIFISYRRKGGLHDARILDEKLRNDGYSVSFDIDTLGRGKFTDKLRTRLKDCKDFLILLEPTYCERFFDENGNVQPEEVLNEDWCYLELKNALQLGKNIIPIVPRGFNFPKNLPAAIKDINEINAIEFTAREFKPIYEHTIKSYLISKPKFTYRYKKTIITVLTLMILGIIGALVYGYKETERKAATQLAEQQARAEARADSLAKHASYIADSIAKLGISREQRILDSLRTQDSIRKAQEQARAAARATTTATTAATVAAKVELYWVGNGDETGRILGQKLGRVGLKTGACAGDGLKVSASKPNRCTTDRRGMINCTYAPQLTVTDCNGSLRENISFGRTFTGTDAKNETDAKQKMISEMQSADFSAWVRQLNALKR